MVLLGVDAEGNAYEEARNQIIVAKANTKPIKKVKPKFDKAYIKRYWQLYVLLLLPMIYLVIFKYVPMYFVTIAFKKYSIVQKIHEMPWAAQHGFEYFINFFVVNY